MPSPEAATSVYQNPFIKAGMLVSGLILTGTTLAACDGSSGSQVDSVTGPATIPSVAVGSTPPYKAPISAEQFPSCTPAVRDAALRAFGVRYKTYLASYQKPGVTQANINQQAVSAIGDLNVAVNLLPPTNVYDVTDDGRLYFRQLPNPSANSTELSFVVNSSTAADASSCTAYDLRVQSEGSALTLSMSGEGNYTLRNAASQPLTMADGQPVSRQAAAELNAITDLATVELTRLAGNR